MDQCKGSCLESLLPRLTEDVFKTAVDPYFPDPDQSRSILHHSISDLAPPAYNLAQAHNSTKLTKPSNHKNLQNHPEPSVIPRAHSPRHSPVDWLWQG